MNISFTFLTGLCERCSYRVLASLSHMDKVPVPLRTVHDPTFLYTTLLVPDCTPLFSLLPFYFIFPLLFFLLAEFCQCVCVCVCMCAADPGSLGNQLPLLPDPKAIASVLKCLQCRLGHSFFHPGRAGAPGLISLVGEMLNQRSKPGSLLNLLWSPETKMAFLQGPQGT